MKTAMGRKLTAADVVKLLGDLQASVDKDECWSCECLQGYLIQLEMDASEDVTALTSPFKVARSEMHECLGCDPCPPGELHASYLRNKRLAENAGK
jgi:hypothetical protein